MEINIKHYKPIMEIEIDPQDIISISDDEMITRGQHFNGAGFKSEYKIIGCEIITRDNIDYIRVLATSPAGITAIYKTFNIK